MSLYHEVKSLPAFSGNIRLQMQELPGSLFRQGFPGINDVNLFNMFMLQGCKIQLKSQFRM